MNYTDVPIFSLMRQKLNYHSNRQAVLAQNVANADTPGYQARDLKEPDFKAMAQTYQNNAVMPMAVTQRGHMQSSASAAGVNSTIKRPSTYERNPNGNNVVIEEEMMRVAENQAEYQRVLSLYRKSVDMIRTALGRQGGG